MKLSKSDIQMNLTGVPGWSVQSDALVRDYELESFPDVVAFVTRLGFEAEKADHHPDLTIGYRKITVTWSTHSEGGITAKDFEGAAATDRIVKAFPHRVRSA